MSASRYFSDMPDAQALKVMRLGLALSQEKLADELGVRRNTVARWERGELGIRNSKMLFFLLDSLWEANHHNGHSG